MAATYLALVPAYNEAATIEAVVAEIRGAEPQFDIVVVDDGSVDETALLAQAAGARVLRLPFNLGIGGAVQAGFRFALENEYDFMVQVDADGQHDPAEIAKLKRAYQWGPSNEMIVGSRFLRGPENAPEYPAPVSRRTGIHVFAFLLRRIIGPRVSDPTSGFRLYNRRAIELFARDYPHDYPEVEAILLLHHHKLTMREVRVTMRERGGGRSSLAGSGKSAYYMLKVLLALGIALVRARPTVPPSEEAAAGAAPRM